MGYPMDLDDMDDEKLHTELARRAEARRNGLCDYCLGKPLGGSGSCCYPDRHYYPWASRAEYEANSKTLTEPST